MARGAGQGGIAVTERGTSQGNVLLALKILVGMFVVGAPAVVVSLFIPGFFGVAFYGVTAAALGWLCGGTRMGASVALRLAALAVVAVALDGHRWALAMFLIALGVGYGIAASRGAAKAFVQIPIMVPYFMMHPPVLFADPPQLDLPYFIGLFGVVAAAGLWTVLVLHVAMEKRTFTPAVVTDTRTPLIAGIVLGVMSAIIMLVGTGTALDTNWAWLTLTLFVLADPSGPMKWAMMLQRITGTLAGFIVVAILSITPMPDHLLPLLALPAMWLCLVFMFVKRPYWQYSFFLTVAVVLMASHGRSTLLTDLERFGFTLVGAAIAVIAAAVTTPLLAGLLDRRRAPSS